MDLKSSLPRLPVFLPGCLAGLLLIGGCASAMPHPSQASSDRVVYGSKIRTELFFGLSRPGGSDLTEEEFAKFIAQDVATRFPQGFTLVRSQGQWRETDGLVRSEPSRILIIIHPNDQASEQKIEQIRETYKTRFAQEAVLRTDESQNVSF